MGKGPEQILLQGGHIIVFLNNYTGHSKGSLLLMFIFQRPRPMPGIGIENKCSLNEYIVPKLFS